MYYHVTYLKQDLIQYKIFHNTHVQNGSSICRLPLVWTRMDRTPDDPDNFLEMVPHGINEQELTCLCISGKNIINLSSVQLFQMCI